MFSELAISLIERNDLKEFILQTEGKIGIKINIQTEISEIWNKFSEDKIEKIMNLFEIKEIIEIINNFSNQKQNVKNNNIILI